ncbi:MAG: hypothetical protein FJZ89_01870 [Chloroflexi bacterium]|nr:hypothetical protein [Chloroflexota bacterium]
MNPHFFFQGKLPREESASAFLATLLEQRADFRSFFFGNIGDKEPQSPCQVKTEHRNVDIRVEYSSAKVVCLIENKVRPGAFRTDQIVLYYKDELSTSADSRIIVILVVPYEGKGGSEMTRLTKHQDFRPMDAGYRVSWGDLAKFCDLLQQEDLHGEFVREGFNCVLKMIDDAAQEKYPLIGGREIAHEIAQAAFQALKQEFPGTGFRLWRGKDFFTIYTIDTDVTIYVDLNFRVDNKTPYTPLEIPDRHHITATLSTQFNLSAKGKRNQQLKEEWDRIKKNGEYDVAHLGLHRLVGKWFKREVPVYGDATLLEKQLVDMGRSVIKGLEKYL